MIRVVKRVADTCNWRCWPDSGFPGDTVIREPCFPTPAFGGALRLLLNQRLPIAPARRISLKGNRVGIGRASPLREMASAAYGVGRESVADVVAGDCPTQLFPQRYRLREDCRREEVVYGTSRFDVLGALGFQHRQRPSRSSTANPFARSALPRIEARIGQERHWYSPYLLETNTGLNPRSTAEEK